MLRNQVMYDYLNRKALARVQIRKILYEYICYYSQQSKT